MHEQRRDKRAFNKFKFYSYLIENSNEFQLNKIIKHINKRLYKNSMKQFKSNLNLYDLLIINYLDIYKEPYLREYKQFISELFDTIYKIYQMLVKAKVREASKKYLKENYNKDIVKNIINFIIENKYIVLIEKSSLNVILCKVILLDETKKFSRKLIETYDITNILTTYIKVNKSNNKTADIVTIFNKQCFTNQNWDMPEQIGHFKGLNNIEDYKSFSNAVYSLVQSNIQKKIRFRCFMCNPYITDLKSLKNPQKETKSKRHKCCQDCEELLERIAKLEQRNKSDFRKSNLKRKIINTFDKENFDITKTKTLRRKAIMDILDKLLSFVKQQSYESKALEEIYALRALTIHIFSNNT